MTRQNSVLNLVLISILFLTLLNSCSIHPKAWTAPSKPAFTGELALNERLTNAAQIELLGYYGAEEFVVDSLGNIYCGVHKGKQRFASGAILKIKPDNSVEEFLVTDNWVTGMQFDKNGDLIALMNDVGVIKIRSDKTIDTLLTQTPNGEAIRMGTGLKIASNGTIYFANMSSTNRTSVKYINKLILEMKPTGGVYAYDPKCQKVSTISEGNYFGNGLAISENEDFILVSETSKYRILRYWISGEKKGQSDIFMDNLAGFPNNILRNKEGNFWLGFTTKRNDQLDKIHTKVGMKKFVYGLPTFIQPKPEKFGMVIEINEKGEILQSLFDSKGTSVTEAGAVFEHNGYLYLGGDVVSYVSKVKL
ncbi:MAG: SMP-30/gluconolactonase/LRE family protein [Saprospiraceae bacterium]|nr:SMP-30/gluconolactonase/LRE family protein [Saprospiraceae bacterium]